MVGWPGGTSAERLLKLQAVADAALAALSVDQLLDALLEAIRDALDADTCAILLLDEDRNELVARAAKGIEEEAERGVRIPVGKGFAGRVAAERRTLAIEDVEHADVVNPILREKGIKSLLGAPLLSRGRVLGVVHVGTITFRRFDDDDAQLLELVATRAALGLERALLHEELLLLDALKRDFVATAAHELRTPASVIYGVAKTLAERRHEVGERTLEQLVAVLHEASARLAQLTEDLLDFSRLEARPSKLTIEPIHVRNVIEELARGLSKTTADVELEIPENLIVVSDRKALERIVGNLVRNAFVHGAPPISIHASTDRGQARISVLDRGKGIPAAFAGRLFDPFARSSESADKPGAGLGLAIAHSYAQQLGGDLSYEPAMPTGCRFTLVLPQPT